MFCGTNSLLGISRKIANSAMNLGGSYILWYMATPCPYLRPDGNPCFDEDSGSAYIDCPLCKGSGSLFHSPRLIKAIYSDNSNKFIQDASGGFLTGEKTLSIPFDVYTSIVKKRKNWKSRRILRDKFELLDTTGSFVVETLWLKQEPNAPTVNSGQIYKIIEVGNNF